MERIDLDALDVLVIENVGNLVCPAVYDLGESVRVVLLSVTEGEDKPLKYPIMFQSAQVILVNKMDIAAAVGFDRETALRNIRRVAPDATILEVSARTGEGMDRWYAYLENAAHRRIPSRS
jgi:hydrogenase nickel incorporation protein HypB